jgi:hypothetical protein
MLKTTEAVRAQIAEIMKEAPPKPIYGAGDPDWNKKEKLWEKFMKDKIPEFEKVVRGKTLCIFTSKGVFKMMFTTKKRAENCLKKYLEKIFIIQYGVEIDFDTNCVYDTYDGAPEYYLFWE